VIDYPWTKTKEGTTQMNYMGIDHHKQYSHMFR